MYNVSNIFEGLTPLTHLGTPAQFISLANVSSVTGVDVLSGANLFFPSLLGSWADSKCASSTRYLLAKDTERRSYDNPF